MLFVICLVLLESQTRWASSCPSAESIDNCKSNVLLSYQVHFHLHNNEINVHALTGQSAIFYCASKLMENRAFSELLYKSNRPQVSMVQRHDKPIGMLDEFVNHSHVARDLRILLVFHQHGSVWRVSVFNSQLSKTFLQFIVFSFKQVGREAIVSLSPAVNSN